MLLLDLQRATSSVYRLSKQQTHRKPRSTSMPIPSLPHVVTKYHTQWNTVVDHDTDVHTHLWSLVWDLRMFNADFSDTEIYWICRKNPYFLYWNCLSNFWWLTVQLFLHLFQDCASGSTMWHSVWSHANLRQDLPANWCSSRLAALELGLVEPWEWPTTTTTTATPGTALATGLHLRGWRLARRQVWEMPCW